MSRSFTTPFLSSRWRLAEGSLDLANAAADADPRIRFPGEDQTAEADRQVAMHEVAGHETATIVNVLPGLLGDERQHAAATHVLAEVMRLKDSGITDEERLAARASELADASGLPRPDRGMRSRYTPTEAALAARWTGTAR